MRVSKSARPRAQGTEICHHSTISRLDRKAEAREVLEAMALKVLADMALRARQVTDLKAREASALKARPVTPVVRCRAATFNSAPHPNPTSSSRPSDSIPASSPSTATRHLRRARRAHHECSSWPSRLEGHKDTEAQDKDSSRADRKEALKDTAGRRDTPRDTDGARAATP